MTSRPSPGAGGSDAPSAVTPVAASMAFTFISSLGTGVVTNAIFILTDNAYGFGRSQNFLLGVVQGVTYIAGALASGPIVAALRRNGRSTRAFLALLSVLMGLLCFLPWAAAGVGVKGSWPVWVLVAAYIPLSGMLWPTLESFLSGGRSGPKLRSTIGWWNVVWSSSLVVTSVALAPLVKGHALLAILLLGVVHFAGLVCLAWYSKNPAPHPHEGPHHCPPVYGRLLVTFRMLVPMAYLVSSALGPYLPGAFARMGLAEHLHTLVMGTWLLSRTLTFAGLERWGGWHGRWAPAILGPALMLAGFAAVVLSVRVPDAAQLACMLGGLLGFGVGMAVIYAGAIYYAMEVGQAEIDAGGKHEALIGVGYGAAR